MAQVFVIRNNNADSWSGQSWIEARFGAFPTEGKAMAFLRHYWTEGGVKATRDDLMLIYFSIIPLTLHDGWTEYRPHVFQVDYGKC